MICSLIAISKSDNNIHENETKVIEAIMLRINLDPYDQTLINFLQNGNNEELFRILSSFSVSVKEWFILFAHLITIADGTIKKIETMHIEILCTSMGISENEYYSTIDKYLNNCNDFKEVYEALFY